MPAHDPLAIDKLRRRCDPASLGFRTTEELEDFDDVIGQDRAVEAIRFGVGIKRDGYNMFALGPTGAGRHSIVMDHLKRAAASEAVPDDWCYVNNFEESHKPNALRMPAGRARPFAQAMDQLVEDLRSALAAAFESDEYRTRRQMLENELKESTESGLEEIQEEARQKNIALMRTQMGLVFAPMKEGEVLNPEDFNKLPEDEQERVKADIEELQKKLQDVMSKFPGQEKEAREKLRQLNRETASQAVRHLIDELREQVKDLPEVLDYLDKVEEDVIENVPAFLKANEQRQQAPIPQQGRHHGNNVPMGSGDGGDDDSQFRRYRVNVVVDNSETEGAPVVYEDHPLLPNLIGRIEHVAQYGALMTDFNLIKPGALHQANGGYLVLDARKLLMAPMAWEELKRAMRSAQIRTESLGQLMSVISTVSLQPEAIPLQVKVVLVGEPMLYYLLCAYDPEFEGLFKVQADFDDRMDRSDESIDLYARLIATMARREQLRNLDASGVARVIEHSSREVEDTERLTVRIRHVLDMLREADYWAREDGDGPISAVHVQKAIDAQIRRSDRIRERMHEGITRDIVLIDTEGARAGQVNGLAVLQIGTFAFGKPSRITARVRLGKGEVVDIERKAELGGNLHTKGVMILSGYLGARFAEERPMSLSASLVFEQSYGGVDGDSASSTELYALLSALSEVPIRQSIAVTGSVNQYGEVQAIGGVNEKIEGFFDICAARGLTGEQGVMIPASNVKHLMLREDVIEACKKGEFHVWAVETIDQGIEILTGVPAGERGADGRFPEDTVNGKVEARLAHYAEIARKLAREGRAPGDGSEDEGDE